MHVTLRVASCMLLLAMLAPATINVADDKPQPVSEAQEPALRQFSEAELSEARETLAALTPEQRAMINHLRYLMRPQFEEAMMEGRAYAPSPVTPYETPGVDTDGAELVRLWAVLVSGMTVTETTRQWVELFVQSPVPEGEDNLSDIGLHMAVCAVALKRAEVGFGPALAARARLLLEASQAQPRATAGNSSLIVRREIDPRWFGNHLWRAVISRHALDLQLKLDSRAWDSAINSLLDAGDKKLGWRSKARNNIEPEDLDANLISIAALSIAAGAPEGTFSAATVRKIEQRMQTVPAVLARLEQDYAGATRVGARAALIASFKPGLAPEGSNAESWRTSVAQFALQLALVAKEPSGMAYDGSLGTRELGLVAGRHSVFVSETALACVALSGGLMGDARPLAGLDVHVIGRAMHAWAVLHAASLPEGSRRFPGGAIVGGAHSLPKAGEMQRFMLKGIDYLVSTQTNDGAWGSGWGGAGRRGAPAAAGDPGSTAFVALALMRAGHKPFSGTHKEPVLKATKYVVEVVEKAAVEGPRITEATGTQLQGKLGSLVDTAIVTQFLSRVLPEVSADRTLAKRVEAALDKCIVKIEASQAEDGSWITSGWAPVLQSAMFNQALELAQLAGREVDPSALARSRAYLRGDVEVGGKATEAPRRSVSAGIAFYGGSSAMRATAADTAEVSIAMQGAIKSRLLPARAEVNVVNLRKIGYDDDAAEAKVAAYVQHNAMLEKLNDEKYLKGFGNNGGEEFISYMLSSEAIVITGHDSWSTWNKKMHDTFSKIQNADGSWTGHHCISSPILCTAAVMLCLTADREVHTLVAAGPSDRDTSSKRAAPKPAPKSSGAVTGKK